MNVSTSSLVVLVVVAVCFQVTCAQVNCTTTGCLNGVCRTDQPVPACQCNAGLILSPTADTVCIDFNECAIGFGTICNHGTCINDFGGFRCQCASGYIAHYNNTYCGDPPRRTVRYRPRSNNNYFNYLMWDEMS